MGAMFGRALRLCLLITLCLAAAAPAAWAVNEKAWFSIDPGGVFYDPEQGFKDNFGIGLRAAGFVNRHLGVEGLFTTSSPNIESQSTGGTFTHFGGGLIVTPDRTSWSIPYLYAGLGSAKADYGTSSGSHGAVHFGAGILLRAGERLGFRLDGRDVTYNQTGAPGRDTRVNTLFISGGITALWFGQPRDTDEDGVPDKYDKSPNTPLGAKVDANGVPLDTDKDGVYDGLDKEPNTPLGAKVDANGVAIDSDHDGVPDGIDQCDNTPAGVVVDAKGCPVDSDGDKVFDGIDKCPDTPLGAVVDAAGCPLDSDGDGIADGIDICPNTPYGTPVNAGGCPINLSPAEQELTQEWMIRLTDLEFPPDSSMLLPPAKARLDEVGQALVQWPMLRIEVGAHVDDQPDPGFRIPLSQMRGRAVLQYLLQKYPSLNAKNFWITGYGDTDPLVPNTSTRNRAQNRRVEFRVMNMNQLYQEMTKRQALGTTVAPPTPGLKPRASAPEQPPVPPLPGAPPSPAH